MGVSASLLSATEAELAEAVSAERLMRDTEMIAGWVRLSGSDEERQAFDYVEAVLSELGMAPERYRAPAYVSLPRRAKLQLEGERLPAITHSMAASTPAGGLRLPLVYVGSGRPEEYEQTDVRGKAALVDGIAMPGKVRVANRAGAAAAVFANRDEHVHEMIVSTVWGSPTPAERSDYPTIPVVSVGRQAADVLRAAVSEGDEPALGLETEVETGWREIPVLTGELRGQHDSFVLFSGHIDSWHYGAMDNGTANATMLETARLLAERRSALRRTLRLAFWSGHSHARYAGSAWYADNFWEDIHTRCVLHLNADSLGGKEASVLTEAHAMAETKPCAAIVIAAVSGDEFAGTRFGRAGDQSFVGHGVPSLFMSLSEQPPREDDSGSGFAELTGTSRSGGLGWWWHTTEDTVEQIDAALLVRDARIYALVAYRFVAGAILPLDVASSASELLGHLRRWQERAQDRFDLRRLVAGAEEVAELARAFQARLAEVDEGLDHDAERLNEALMAAERPLVRANYMRSDPFAHDPALNQPPVPALAPLDQLVAAEKAGDEEYELVTLLVRRRNRLMFELSQAREALQQGLALAGPR